MGTKRHLRIVPKGEAQDLVKKVDKVVNLIDAIKLQKDSWRSEDHDPLIITTPSSEKEKPNPYSPRPARDRSIKVDKKNITYPKPQKASLAMRGIRKINNTKSIHTLSSGPSNLQYEIHADAGSYLPKYNIKVTDPMKGNIVDSHPETFNDMTAALKSAKKHFDTGKW